MVTPEIENAIEGAKAISRLAEEVDEINFFSEALSPLLRVKDEHSGINSRQSPPLSFGAAAAAAAGRSGPGTAGHGLIVRHGSIP